MPDRFPGLFRVVDFIGGRQGRHETAQPFGVAADGAEFNIGKANQPIAGFDFGNAGPREGGDERLAEEDQVAALFDLTVAAHSAHSVLDIVPALRDLAGEGPQRGAVAAGRRNLTERFVRAMVIKVAAEAAEEKAGSPALLSVATARSTMKAICWSSERRTRICSRKY